MLGLDSRGEKEEEEEESDKEALLTASRTVVATSIIC